MTRLRLNGRANRTIIKRMRVRLLVSCVTTMGKLVIKVFCLSYQVIQFDTGQKAIEFCG